jgi:hypothetical protein
MKRIVLAGIFILTASLQAGSMPQPRKKESVKEHKALTGLKATGAAAGAGLALYVAREYYELLRQDGAPNNVLAWAALAFYLYPAFTLGRKALTLTRLVPNGDQSTSEESGVAKEHKAVSGLKAAGAAVGAGFGLVLGAHFGFGFLRDLNFDNSTLCNGVSFGCAAYIAYRLGYEKVPVYMKRVLNK